MLTNLRHELVQTLQGLTIIPVHDMWPKTLDPPALLVVPSRSSDYMTRGQVRGAYEVALEIVAIVPVSDRATEQSELDTILEHILNLDLKTWVFRGVTGTGLMEINQVKYPSTSIRFIKQTKL